MTEAVHLTIAKTVPVEVEIAFDDLVRGISDEQLRAECLRRGIAGVCEAPALTGRQIRGARGLLDLSMADLAAASGVSVSTLKRIEDASTRGRPDKHAAIRRALRDGGVHFVSVGGIAGLLQDAAALPRSESAEATP